jgi:hypothetical protein
MSSSQCSPHMDASPRAHADEIELLPEGLMGSRGGASTDPWATGRQMPVAVSANLNNTEDTSIAVDGSTVAIGPGNGVHVSTLTRAQPPQVTHTTLTGLTTIKPRLSLMIAKHHAGPSIDSVRIALPTWLKLARSPSVRQKGMTVAGGVTVKRSPDALTVTLNKPAPRTTISIGSGALVPSGRLRGSRHSGREILASASLLRRLGAAVPSALPTAAEAVADS